MEQSVMKRMPQTQNNILSELGGHTKRINTREVVRVMERGPENQKISFLFGFTVSRYCHTTLHLHVLICEYGLLPEFRQL